MLPKEKHDFLLFFFSFWLFLESIMQKQKHLISFHKWRGGLPVRFPWFSHINNSWSVKIDFPFALLFQIIALQKRRVSCWIISLLMSTTSNCFLCSCYFRIICFNLKMASFANTYGFFFPAGKTMLFWNYRCSQLCEVSNFMTIEPEWQNLF